MNLAKIIEAMYPGIAIPDQCEIHTDGSGSRIAVWRYPATQPTEAEIDAAAVPAAKAQRIAAINAECRRRLLARFGDPAEQVSRAIGVYGLAEKSAMETGIAATIDATNTASDAVAAATTIADVEAVAVAWPVI